MGKETFEQHFGKIGHMMCASLYGYSKQPSLINDATIETITEIGDKTYATICLPKHLTLRFPWLEGDFSVSGECFKSAFVLSGDLKNFPSMPSIIPFTTTRARIILKNQKLILPQLMEFIDEEIWESELEILLEGSIGKSSNLPITFSLYPSQIGEHVSYYGIFGDGDFTNKSIHNSPENSSTLDATTFVLDCLGVSIDFTSIVPNNIPLIESIHPGRFCLTFKQPTNEKEINELIGLSVRLYYGKKGEIFKILCLSLKDLYIDLGISNQAITTDSLVSTVGGKLVVGGVELNFSFGKPYRHLIIDTKNQNTSISTPLSKIVEALGVSAPVLFSVAIIDEVFLKADFPSKILDTHFLFSRKSNKEISFKGNSCCLLEWYDTALCLKIENGNTQVGLISTLVLYEADKAVGYFNLSGELKSSKLYYSCSWKSCDFTLNHMYELIFGCKLPSTLPIFNLLSMGIKGSVSESIVIDNFSAIAKIEVKDVSLIGSSFSMLADVSADDKSISCKGCFEFSSYFNIEATYSWGKDTSNSWSFALLLDQWSIKLSYKSAIKTLTGSIEKACTLKQLIDSLLDLINPSERFTRTDAWSFLDSLSFTGCSFNYLYDKQQTEFSLNMNYKNAFLDMKKLTVILNNSGITLNIVGDFMGTTYNEAAPLSFQPNQCPDTGGRGFSVNYLVLSDGLITPTLSGTSVEIDIETLRKEWNKSTTITELTKKANAGVLFGMEFLLASMVKVQLIYRESTGYCGGRFELSGSKAGSFTGMSAELSYSKLQSDLGVFSGRFSPSNNLRIISLGSITLGLGDMEARVYTNGDFYLNMGFPEKPDFSRSFSISYGAFNGKGGVYIQKNSQLSAQSSPYNWCFKMGLGLHLSLGTDYSSNMFSAKAMLIMVGCFEGTYGSKLTNQKLTDGIYKLSATAQFQGILEGKVDFGIIGASVNINLLSSADLTLQSNEPTEVHLYFLVSATASIKVVWVKVNFGFSMSGNLYFHLGSKNDEILIQRKRNTLILPTYDVQPQKYTLRMAPIFTRVDNQIHVNLFLLMEHNNFSDMLISLGKVLKYNNFLCDECGLELFDRLLYFRTKEEIYELLAANFIFKIEPFSQSHVYTQNPVFFPLPEFLRQSVITEYKSGQVDYSKRELNTYAYAGEDYVKLMQDYYAETKPNYNHSTENTVSMTAQIFSDFFDLIIRAIKAEKHSCLIKGERFEIEQLTVRQVGNIQGMANRFLLGGRRGLHHRMKNMYGIFNLSGQQVPLVDSDRVNKFCFKIEPLDNCPSWLEFPEPKKSELILTLEQVSLLSPAKKFTNDIFVESPKIATFYDEKVDFSPQVTPILETERFIYYKGVAGKLSNNTSPQYGGIFWLSLSPVSRVSPIFSVTGYGDTRFINEWSISNRAVSLELLYPNQKGDYHHVESNQLYCMGSSKDNSKHIAFLFETVSFLDIVKNCTQTGEALYMAYAKNNCPISMTEETKIFIVVKLSNQIEYENYCTCIIGNKDTPIKLYSEKKEWKQKLEFGNIVLTCSTSSNFSDGAQEQLYAIYNNMGVELVNGGSTTHETPPYIGQDKEGVRVYEVLIPYIKACKTENSPYHLITTKKALTICPFFIDMLGNRMNIGKDFSWTPLYTDSLIGLWEYQGITLSTSYKGSYETPYLCFNIDYMPDINISSDDVMQESAWLRGPEQLIQEDVAIEMHVSILNETVRLSKDNILCFIKECQLRPKEKNRLSLFCTLDKLKTGAKLHLLTHTLRISRKSELCISEGPESVHLIQREIMLIQKKQDKVPPNLQLYNSWNDNYMLILNRNKLFKNISINTVYGFLPFPSVAGIYKEGSKNYALSGIGLNSILDNFLRDIQFLLSVDTLYQIANNSDLKEHLNGIYNLRRTVAKALASRIEPFSTSVSTENIQTMRKEAETFFLQNSSINRKHLIFLQGSGECEIELPLIYRGVIGKGNGFPFGIDLSKKGFTFCGAIDANISIPAGNIEMNMRYLRDNEIGSSYAPFQSLEGTQYINLNLEKDIVAPTHLPPEAPILLSYVKGKEVDLTFYVRPAHDIKLCLKFDDIKRNQNAEPLVNQALSAMEQYRRESPTLVKLLTATNLKKLLELMKEYSKAVEDFPHEASLETYTHSFSFQTNETGSFTKLISYNSNLDKDWRIFYQTGISPLCEMIKATDGWLFVKDWLPNNNDMLLLKMTIPNNEELSVEEGGKILVLQNASCENRKFHLESPVINF